MFAISLLILSFLKRSSSLPNKMPLNSEGLQVYLLDSILFFVPML